MSITYCINGEETTLRTSCYLEENNYLKTERLTFGELNQKIRQLVSYDDQMTMAAVAVYATISTMMVPGEYVDITYDE